MFEDLRRTFDALTRLEALEEAAAQRELADHRRKLLALAAEFPPGSPFAAALEAMAAALLMDRWPDGRASRGCSRDPSPPRCKAA